MVGSEMEQLWGRCWQLRWFSWYQSRETVGACVGHLGGMQLSNVVGEAVEVLSSPMGGINRCM
eukprot:3155206-Ditylum_brightwellii.AAC.1